MTPKEEQVRYVHTQIIRIYSASLHLCPPVHPDHSKDYSGKNTGLGVTPWIKVQIQSQLLYDLGQVISAQWVQIWNLQNEELSLEAAFSFNYLCI